MWTMLSLTNVRVELSSQTKPMNAPKRKNWHRIRVNWHENEEKRRDNVDVIKAIGREILKEKKREGGMPSNHQHILMKGYF